MILAILFLTAFLNITHVARHTFSTTICLDNGLPIETLSKMLGHSDIKITQAYAKVSNRKIEEDVNKLNSILQ